MSHRLGAGCCAQPCPVPSGQPQTLAVVQRLPSGCWRWGLSGGGARQGGVHCPEERERVELAVPSRAVTPAATLR
jgi:hypothetical protein